MYDTFVQLVLILDIGIKNLLRDFWNLGVFILKNSIHDYFLGLLVVMLNLGHRYEAIWWIFKILYL
jgi:hypothetical protein